MIKNFSAVLKNKIFLNEKIIYLNFQTTNDFKLEYQAGQYLIAKIPKDNQKLNRLYSIASYNNDKTSFDLLIEIVDNGLGSNYFKNLNIGEKTEFAGPAGIFTLKNQKTAKVFLATGTGLAPIKAMIEKLIFDKFSCPFYLFWGIKYKKSLYFLNEFKNLKNKNKNFDFKICFSQEKEIKNDENKNFFDLGRVNKCLVDYFKNKDLIYNDFEYYICGSREITDSLKNFLISLNINKNQIFFEKF
ncbi:MAG: hypothetical protein KatS3mg092_0715 [Patescibacteria group bacterium]|nr:MAG: hypothetical protein KatS3mg092_0715 [Patescibacteria group bacterium]